MSVLIGFLFRRKKKRRVRARKVATEHREAARVLVHARLSHFNQFYNFEYKKVFIKNTKTRWGSCSSRKNLNFNYRIIRLSPELADYLVVHELCHLQEFNHSKDFWSLVAQTIPDHAKRSRELRRIPIK